MIKAIAQAAQLVKSMRENRRRVKPLIPSIAGTMLRIAGTKRPMATATPPQRAIMLSVLAMRVWYLIAKRLKWNRGPHSLPA